MFEVLAANCCNFSKGRCLACFYRVDSATGFMSKWIDPKLAEKPCRVTCGLPCSFFNSTVVPSIPSKQNQTLGLYQMAVDRKRRAVEISQPSSESAKLQKVSKDQSGKRQADVLALF